MSWNTLRQHLLGHVVLLTAVLGVVGGGEVRAAWTGDPSVTLPRLSILGEASPVAPWLTVLGDGVRGLGLRGEAWVQATGEGRGRRPVPLGLLGWVALAALGLGVLLGGALSAIDGRLAARGPPLSPWVRAGALAVPVALLVTVVSGPVPALVAAAGTLVLGGLVLDRPRLVLGLTGAVVLFTVTSTVSTARGIGARLPPGPRAALARPHTRVLEDPDAPPPGHRKTAAWRTGTGSPIPRPARVLLIAVDTVRADHLSVYGYDRETTPRLSKVLGEEGVVFERAYSSAPWTLPSTTSLFTSLHTPQHGVENSDSRLHREVPTVAGAFAAQGWTSAAFVTHIYVSSRFGLDSGFHEFHELSIDWGFGEGRQLRAEALNDEVLPWLSAHAEEPVFAYLHYFDPHWDYEPPPPWDAKWVDPAYDGPGDGSWAWMSPFIPRDKRIPEDDLANCVALYDGELSYTDQKLGELFDGLKRLGLWEDTLIVLVSDHGEEFQEHGGLGHTLTLYEELLHVPLVMKLPGGRPEGVRDRIHERVRTLDVAPSLLHAAGLAWPDPFEGESLLPLLTTPGPDRDVFARSRRSKPPMSAMIHGDHKLIWEPGTASVGRLHELRADPAERLPLERRSPELAANLREKMQGWLDQMQGRGDAVPKSDEAVELSAEEEAHLKSLGYVQ